MRAISRRKFVTTSAILAGGAALGLYRGTRRNQHRGTICLLPVEGVTYTETFSRFMKRARFDSVRDALASIRDRSLPVTIAHIANDRPAPLTKEPRSMVCPTRRTEISRAAGHSLGRGALPEHQS